MSSRFNIAYAFDISDILVPKCLVELAPQLAFGAEI